MFSKLLRALFGPKTKKLKDCQFSNLRGYNVGAKALEYLGIIRQYREDHLVIEGKDGEVTELWLRKDERTMGYVFKKYNGASRSLRGNRRPRLYVYRVTTPRGKRFFTLRNKDSEGRR